MKAPVKLRGSVVMLARFDGSPALLHAARELRAAGYWQFECHSPFPVHGMDAAVGEKPSRVSFFAGVGAFLGLLTGITMQSWMAGVDYPHIVSGKPFFSFPAFFPVTFALAVLFSALGSVIGFLSLARLRYHHTLFDSPRFESFSDDAFFVSVSASDPRFDVRATRELLERLGGEDVEVLEG